MQTKSLEHINSTEELRQSIIRACWERAGECPRCGCESTLTFAEQTGEKDRTYVEGCRLCNAVVEAILDGTTD